MILSRVFAKQRMKNGVRPAFTAAWGLVLLDFGIVVLTLGLIFEPIMLFMYAAQPDDGLSMLFMMLLYVVWPLWVLIRGCVWAYRSRQVST